MSTAIEDILGSRGATHGEFRDHAGLTQGLKRVFYEIGMAKTLPELSDIEREALDMIFHKIGRIGSGDPHVADHWVDIAGYAKLVADRLS